MPSGAPPLILVVGMHRSGTSLLGSLLQAIGVATPGPLIAGDHHNPEGYIERQDVTALQEQLLIDLGRWWPSAAGDQPLPADWLEHPATAATRQRLRALLLQESTAQSGPWAIKDPRTSLLLPLWRQLAEELAIPLRLLLATRHPAEVCVSLCRRDRALAGMTAERAQRLWWHHNRQLLLDSADLPLQVIDYGRWFQGPAEARRQLAQLQHACGIPADPAAGPDSSEQALARIRPEHRRSLEPLQLLPAVARLHRRLNRLSRHPDPALRRRLQAELQHPRGLRPLQLPPARAQSLEPGSWFDPKHYLAQRPDLQGHPDLLSHYLAHGWQENSHTQPHPLFQPEHYRHVCERAGLSCNGNPLVHFLQHGLHQQLAPGPLVDPAWIAARGLSLGPHQPLRLARLHPWGAAAEALSAGDAAAARQRLSGWLHHGFTAAELEQLAALEPWPALPEPASATTSFTTAAAETELFCRGATPLHWAWHAWRQHIPAGVEALNLLPLEGAGEACQALLTLSRLGRVCDPDPQRVALLRRLGVAAERLAADPAAAAGPQGLQNPALLEQAATDLGLPAPAGLLGPGAVLVLGSGGDGFDQQLQAPILGLPGFDQLHIETASQARALAAWLQACHGAGLQLIRLNPSASERILMPFTALMPPSRGDQLPGQLFQDPLDPAAIAEELAWRRAGCPAPPAPQTPQPQHRLLWSHDGPEPPAGAIVISLYNYADRITAALASAAAQTLGPLELIVVDDASRDDGPARVQAWLEQHGQRFARVRLLQHLSNGGLAAARNTAFAAAASPWCFVLDADNTLEPTALARTLALAAAATPRTAVVFPLVEARRSSPSGATSEGLISRVSWQRQQFLAGNVVDAMALVRRSAWQAVGGYAHIPGGWEDFDFWCSLIDAGWHGVLCPERLAVYHRHASSMLQQQTDRHVRRISRLLQARHPWLELPMAQPDR